MSVYHMLQMGGIVMMLFLPLVGTIAFIAARVCIWLLCQMESDSQLKLFYEWRESASETLLDHWGDQP